MARTVVGLDIGTAGIRVVEAKATAKGLTVLRHGSVALPAGAVEGGVVAQPEVVTDALRLLWSQAKISGTDVRIGVGSGSVLARQLDLDWMPEADLRKSLRYQVGDLLPVPVDDANLDLVYLGDHEVVDDDGTKTRKVVRILLIATSRSAVDGLVECVKAAKLRPAVADLGALALVRAAASSTNRQAQPEAILDIGVDKVTVAVHTGGRPHAIRVITGVGGALLTRGLVEQTDRDWAAAERAKCGSGRLPTVGHPAADVDEATLHAATMRMLSEVRSTLEFHAASDPANRPTRVLVAGATGALPGLLDLCESMLGLPVHRFDGTSGIEPLAPRGNAGEQGQVTDLVLALGLCMEVAA